MTLLRIMSVNDAGTVQFRTDDPDLIRSRMSELGITVDRWPVPEHVNSASATADILAEFADRIAELTEKGGYQLVDVARIHPSPDPEWPAAAMAARTRFLDEHRHAEDEVRFFVAGAGCFYLRLGGEVCAVVCTRGDLISVPAGTLHWFDMGANPEFVAIRFFKEADGWVGDFTGDPISHDFPTFDELLRECPLPAVEPR